MQSLKKEIHELKRLRLEFQAYLIQYGIRNQANEHFARMKKSIENLEKLVPKEQPKQLF